MLAETAYKDSVQRQPAETNESIIFQKIPKIIQKNTRESKKNPKKFKRIKKNTKVSKRIKKNPKDSKRFQMTKRITQKGFIKDILLKSKASQAVPRTHKDSIRIQKILEDYKRVKNDPNDSIRF